MQAQIEAFFESATATVTYVVYADPGSACAVIDPVLDYDARSGRTATHAADRVIAFIRERELSLQWLLETHAHADHLSAAPYLQRALGGIIAIGSAITQVQAVFKQLFNLGDALMPDGASFGHLFAAGERFKIGELDACALHVPGHTPADLAYQVGDAVFVGDTLFMPDVGSARCDFPGGDARLLYRSVRQLLSLPDQTRLFMCHDYPPDARLPAWQTTVGEQRRANIHLRDDITEAAFVQMRTARDRTLETPALMLPAIQLNIRAGAWPEPEDNGVRYLKIPLNAL